MFFVTRLLLLQSVAVLVLLAFRLITPVGDFIVHGLALISRIALD
jgi:hypothetical protein